MTPTATLVGAQAGSASVVFTLVDTTGATVATATGKGGADAAEADGDTVVSVVLSVKDAELWSVPRPYLYTLKVEVRVGEKLVDSTSQSVGIRNLAWDAERGLIVNEQRVKMRGACNHESFTGVGAALPDRVDLLRVQQMRGVGMNAWR
jgi:beta-galactosidase/beta-glucuronidase